LRCACQRLLDFVHENDAAPNGLNLGKGVPAALCAKMEMLPEPGATQRAAGGLTPVCVPGPD
jgi:hypothetical protein